MPKQRIELRSKRIITKSFTPPIDDLKKGCMVLVDKPLGWTSFDVVNKIRSSIKYATGIKKMKVGHTGTLDPMAKGLLLVCIGKYTKLIDQLSNHDKGYEGVIKLGATTPSYDRELPEENVIDRPPLKENEILLALDHFTGNYHQIPPIYSAIKIKGKPAHKIARKGQSIEMHSRPIHIFTNNLIRYDYPYIYVDVIVSKGTYIRSLAHDIGQHLGLGGYLYALKRTSIDNYNLADALNIEEVVAWIDHLPEQELGV